MLTIIYNCTTKFFRAKINLKRKQFYVGVAALICATTLFSCKDNPGQIGLDTGGNTNITVVDTFSVFTRTVREDSFISDQLSYYILGAINSNDYGKSQSAIAMNFTLPAVPNFSFPPGSQVDSVFLVMEYAGANQFNGNTSTALAFEVQEITEQLHIDTTYYSSRNISADPTPIGFATDQFNPDDSITVIFKGTTQKQAPQLRIRLDNATFGSKLVASPASNFTSNTALQSFIKGLNVKANNDFLPPNDGSAAWFALKRGISGIHVYYNDTQFVNFPVTDASSVINLYRHDFSGSAVESQLNTSGNYNTGYLQSMAGTRLLVEIPGLDNISLDGNYAIVGANLVISADPAGISSGFPAPTRLLLLSRDSAGAAGLVLDAGLEPTLYNGNYNSTALNYEFNLPRHIQYLITEKKDRGRNLNKGFYLRIPADNPITATRLLVDTQKGAARGIKLKLHVIKVR